ncbi:MAG: hypothetical protein PUF72_06470 [Clostridiales bacterium]|nr:hypothetical protein [Clostridiales bacterium]
MLGFYLAFWKENKHCLTDGKLSAQAPEAGYGFISSETKDKIIAVSYVKSSMSIKKTV